MNLDIVPGKLTKKFLRSLSYHLSCRVECRGLEYTVWIYPDEDLKSDIIEVSPYITVHPNLYKRKDSDKRAIAYHIIYNHFPEIFYQSDPNIVQVKHGFLVPGTYKFIKHTHALRRRWEKTSEEGHPK